MIIYSLPEEIEELLENPTSRPFFLGRWSELHLCSNLTDKRSTRHDVSFSPSRQSKNKQNG